MTNRFYPKGLEGFVDGSIDWDTDDIRCVILDATYVYDSADEDLADITGQITGGTSGAFASKTVALGVLDAADVVLATPDPDIDVGSVVIYLHTGTPATSRLIMYLDEGDTFPLTTDGSALTIQWSSSGIGRIGV